MRSVFEQASKATSKTSKEKILQDYGLHGIKVSRHQGFDFIETEGILALFMGLSVF
jgi:hypothetical protein